MDGDTLYRFWFVPHVLMLGVCCDPYYCCCVPPYVGVCPQVGGLAWKFSVDCLRLFGYPIGCCQLGTGALQVLTWPFCYYYIVFCGCQVFVCGVLG